MIRKLVYFLPVGIINVAISFIGRYFFDISDFVYGFLHGISLVFIIAGAAFWLMRKRLNS